MEQPKPQPPEEQPYGEQPQGGPGMQHGEPIPQHCAAAGWGPITMTDVAATISRMMLYGHVGSFAAVDVQFTSEPFDCRNSRDRSTGTRAGLMPRIASTSNVAGSGVKIRPIAANTRRVLRIQIAYSAFGNPFITRTPLREPTESASGPAGS